ncbi:MAG: Holliday junction branch migration protein RuvA [Gammaproteobacteria bacterium]|nr:Holliday junction branch migration protein RuvA [Gammaproteobacteria bacterium]
MIGRLHGRLLVKQPPQILLEVGGVGYELEAPLSTFYRLPAVGEAVMLHTHLTVREDAHLLFGFASAEEKSLFRELIRLNGVGPKLALTILSGVGVEEFWATVRAQDAAKLTRLPGIGKKTAERLVMELKDRAGKAGDGGARLPAAGAGASPLHEACSALESLGYKPAEAQRMSDAVFKDGMEAEAILREALRRAVR